MSCTCLTVFDKIPRMNYFKVKTRQQVAIEYGISPRTLRRWLKQNEIKLPNRLLGPKEQKIIYSEFGNPVINKNIFNK